MLKDYKRSPSERVRERHLWQAAAILHRFVFNHRQCIVGAAGRDWDTVAIVPSKTPRDDPHPLEQAIMLGEPLRSEYRRLLELNEPDAIGRARSSDRGYRTAANVNGLRVLLVDDTSTSGATLQSAASALALGGADVVAGVVIGRVIDTSDTERHPEKLALWEQQRRIPFSFAPAASNSSGAGCFSANRSTSRHRRRGRTSSLRGVYRGILQSYCVVGAGDPPP